MEFLSSAALMATALGTILYGARRSYPAAAKPGGEHVSQHDAAAAPPQTSTITMTQAALFPVIGSAVLLTLFLAFKYLDWALVLYILALSLGSTAMLLAPLVAAVLPDVAGGRRCCRASHAAVTAALSAAVTVVWAVTGHWAANNVIGVGVCVALMTTLRLPGLKVAAVALLGLLVYDLYWVFFSPAHFGGKSVMVEVATQEASNPLRTAADAVPALRDALPAAWLPAPTLALPNKLSLPVYAWLPAEPELVAAAAEAASAGAPDASFFVFSVWPLAGTMVLFAGYTFLGLGDIALPGLLLALAHRVDVDKAAAEAARIVADEAAGGGGAIATSSSGSVDDEEAGTAEDAPLVRPALSDPVPVGAGTGLQQRRAAGFATGADATLAPPPSMPPPPPLPQAPASRWPAACVRLGGVLAACIHGLTDTLRTPSYLRTAYVGYAAGLAMAVVVSRAFHAAQPALIYLVPCTLLPLLWRARAQSELRVLWEGRTLHHRDETAPASSVAAVAAADATAAATAERRPPAEVAA